MNVQKKILKIAGKIIADYDYIYDPNHEKNLGGGYERTEKGWSKDKVEKNESGKNGMTDEQKKLHEKSTSGYWEEREEVACSPKAHPKTLDDLSNDPEVFVRMEVARNRSTHPKTLRKLTKDKDQSVRETAAKNFNSRPRPKNPWE